MLVLVCWTFLGVDGAWPISEHSLTEGRGHAREAIAETHGGRAREIMALEARLRLASLDGCPGLRGWTRCEVVMVPWYIKRRHVPSGITTSVRADTTSGRIPSSCSCHVFVLKHGCRRLSCALSCARHSAVPPRAFAQAVSWNLRPLGSLDIILRTLLHT